MMGKLCALCVGIGFLIGALPCAFAQDTYTFDPQVGTEGVWQDPANWTGGPVNTKPGADDTAIIPSGLTCIVGDADQAVRRLEIEADDNGTPGDLEDDIPGILLIDGATLALGSVPGGGSSLDGILRFGLDGTLEILGVHTVRRTPTIKIPPPPPKGPSLMESPGAQGLILKARGETANDRLIIAQGTTVTGNLAIATHVDNHGLFLAESGKPLVFGPQGADPANHRVRGNGLFYGDGSNMFFHAVRLEGSFDLTCINGGSIWIHEECETQNLSGDITALLGGTITVRGNYTTTGFADVGFECLLEISQTGNLEAGDLDLSGYARLEVAGSCTVEDDARFIVVPGAARAELELTGQMTVTGDLTGEVSVPQEMSGALTVDGNVTASVIVDADLTGTIDVGGTLHDPNEDLLGGHIIVNGSFGENSSIAIDGGFAGDTEFIAIDYDGWDSEDTWESGATVTLPSDSPCHNGTIAGNTPCARVWEITSERADMNNDSAVDSEDIDGFFEGLGTDETGDPYGFSYPGLLGSMAWHGDCNEDGDFDTEDIDPFFDCVKFGGCGFYLSAQEVAALIAEHVRPAKLASVVELLDEYSQNTPRTGIRSFWSAVLAILREA